MSRTSIATPCPAPYTLSNLPIPVTGRRLSTTSVGSVQDDTAELDYTRAIQVEFKNAKPRRKSTFQRRERKDAGITIFEDVLEDQELVVESKPHLGGSTLLGKRAQKMPGRPLPKEQNSVKNAQQPLQTTSQARRRPSIVPESLILEDEPWRRTHTGEDNNDAAEPLKTREALKKEPRRRTIFVPPDDTTVLTIHPGANTTDRLNDTFQLSDFAVKHPTETDVGPPVLYNVPQPAKRPRMSLAAAPKRVPLQQVAPQEANMANLDIAGQNGGKENMPPEARALSKLKDNKAAFQADIVDKSTRGRSSVFEPTAASRARQSIVPRNAVPLSRSTLNATRRRTTVAESAVTATHVKSSGQSLLLPPVPKYRPPPVFDAVSEESKPTEHMRRSKPVERRTARLQQYPVLSEDIAQPELYEDSWLGHQEIALTELINEIFDAANPVQEEWERPKKSLRERLIGIYHQQNVATLHKRLRASLLYGALSRPKDAPSLPSPAHDIGLRKRFLSLWLESYNQKSLHTAAEVIFGRQLPQVFPKSTGSEGSLDPHHGRRTLIGFLETFLIEVEDAEDPDEERGDNPHGRWRKMILRSLMLIWLLDHAKASQAVQGCLFKPTSPRKTSGSMLHALAGMLIPSVGDIGRVLRHLDYEVSHVQDPLDEVKHRITNVAVDLRDGVLLARLVELLLFAPNNALVGNTAADATISVQLPDLTILESALYNTEGMRCPRILSQHLKMPCLGRAQKVYNVEVVISALHNHGRLGDGAVDVTADDIVDGHREKTLSLLWSLVSTHGLEQLVDFGELATDIGRCATSTFDLEALPNDRTCLTQIQQESLLEKWASVHCVQSGVRIGNLTTSFADGKAYAAILAEFTDYIPFKSSRHPTSPKIDSRGVEAQLYAFGCSTAFIKQLASICGTIPSRKTTISNLAFLASRLLPLARRHNAAMVIQRAFRFKGSKIFASQRITLMRLAHTCATIVQTRNKLISAAVVLQRSWRAVLDARILRLNTDVERFQAVAKSWMSRRRVRRERGGVRLNDESLRTMGGW